VLMADRVLILRNHPGRIHCQLAVQLPRPREPDSVDVRALINEVYALMTTGAGRRAAPVADEPVPSVLTERLPEADVARMEGLLELLMEAPFDGRADLPQLADESELTDAELLPAANAVLLLGLAQLENGDLQLTPLGRRYAEGTRTLRQEIFGQQLLTHVPLAAHIRHSLEQEPSGKLPDRPFLRLLRGQLDPTEADRVLRTAVAWGRYGEVYEYDYRTGIIRLPTGIEDGDEARS